MTSRPIPRRALATALVAVTAVFALTGCTIPRLDRDPPPERNVPALREPSSAAPSPSNGSGGEERIAGLVPSVWLGKYTCAQGVTGLRLVILSGGPSGLKATFNFFAVPENPSVPEGTYAMTGSYSAGKLELTGDYWIERPGAYQMVGLSATFPDEQVPSRLTGRIDSSSCAEFTLERRSS